MSDQPRNKWKLQPWIGIAPYFIIPLLLIIIFNWERIGQAKGETIVGYLEFNPEFNVWTTLGFILFIALMLERFLEVLINTSRNPRQIRYEATRKKYRDDLKILQTEITKVESILEEINTLSGKSKNAETRQKAMGTRSRSLTSSKSASSADQVDKIQVEMIQVKGEAADYQNRLEELHTVVIETYHPMLLRRLDQLFDRKYKEGEAKREEFNNEYKHNPEDSTNILANILRADKELVHLSQDLIGNIGIRSAEYRTETRILAIKLAFAAGIIVSLIGFRTLREMIIEDKFASLDSIQYVLFTWVDVMLTGGVIAGGSEGIHRIANVYTSFTDRASNRLSAEEVS